MRNGLFILLAVALSGCHICTEHPMEAALGDLDLTREGSHATFALANPPHPRCITLVIADEMGTNRPYCKHPTWPLVLSAVSTDQRSGRALSRKTLTATNMVFGNWNLPDTCVILDHNPWENGLKDESSCQLELRVLSPAAEAGKASVRLHWVED